MTKNWHQRVATYMVAIPQSHWMLQNANYNVCPIPLDFLHKALFLIASVTDLRASQLAALTRTGGVLLILRGILGIIKPLMSKLW